MLTNDFSGVDFDNVDIFSFDISMMNTVIDAYNTANNTNYPKWDTITDNFERFCQFLLVYCQVQQLLKGNDTLNLKITSVSPGNQIFGSRGSLSSKVISVGFPFTNQSDLWGDPDNLG